MNCIFCRHWCYCPCEKVLVLISQLETIVGGVYPNRCIDVTGKLTEINVIIKACLNGYYDEVKVAVVSFEDPLLGMCPYLVLVENTQTITEINDFGKHIMKLCQEASDQVGYCIVLNQFTDKVS